MTKHIWQGGEYTWIQGRLYKAWVAGARVLLIAAVPEPHEIQIINTPLPDHYAPELINALATWSNGCEESEDFWREAWLDSFYFQLTRCDDYNGARFWQLTVRLQTSASPDAYGERVAVYTYNPLQGRSERLNLQFLQMIDAITEAWERKIREYVQPYESAYAEDGFGASLQPR